MAELTGRFDKALMYASALNRLVRSGSADHRSFSYALWTAALVLEAGGNEDEAIAALLLDVAGLEKGAAILAEISPMFGDDVYNIIRNCLASDYRVPCVSRGDVREFSTKLAAQLNVALPVALADSMVKASVIYSDLIVDGLRAWARYQEGKDALLEHYDLLARSFALLVPSALAERFSYVVAELGALASPYADDGITTASIEAFRPRIVPED